MANKTIKVGQIELEDQIYRLVEMSESMDASIDNVEKVINENETLLDILNDEHIDEATINKLKSFIEEMNGTHDQLVSQHKKMQTQKALLDKVIELCDGSFDARKAVVLLLHALKVFASMEDRGN